MSKHKTSKLYITIGCIFISINQLHSDRPKNPRKEGSMAYFFAGILTCFAGVAACATVKAAIKTPAQAEPKNKQPRKSNEHPEKIVKPEEINGDAEKSLKSKEINGDAEKIVKPEKKNEGPNLPTTEQVPKKQDDTRSSNNAHKGTKVLEAQQTKAPQGSPIIIHPTQEVRTNELRPKNISVLPDLGQKQAKTEDEQSMANQQNPNQEDTKADKGAKPHDLPNLLRSPRQQTKEIAQSTDYDLKREAKNGNSPPIAEIQKGDSDTTPQERIEKQPLENQADDDTAKDQSAGLLNQIGQYWQFAIECCMTRDKG